MNQPFDKELRWKLIKILANIQEDYVGTLEALEELIKQQSNKTKTNDTTNINA